MNVFSKYLDVFIRDSFFLIITLRQSVRFQCFRFKFISNFLNDLRFLGCGIFPMETADGMSKYFREVNLDFATGIKYLWFSIQLAHEVQLIIVLKIWLVSFA